MGYQQQDKAGSRDVGMVAPCHLLMFRRTNPAHKRLSFSGFLFLRTIFTIQGTHIVFLQCRLKNVLNNLSLLSRSCLQTEATQNGVAAQTRIPLYTTCNEGNSLNPFTKPSRCYLMHIVLGKDLFFIVANLHFSYL